MFEYARPAGPPSDGPRPALRPTGFATPSAAAALGALSRRKWVVLGCVLLGAVSGWAATKLIPPKFVATTQIYVDPGNLPGADKDALGAGQDSNGFINYVESQGLIITSRQVLRKVVADEKLDTDPEFIGGSGSSLFSLKVPSGEDLSDSAVSTLRSRLHIWRPERTFIIELSASARDPEKAARLANATAQAFIQVSAKMQRDAAGRAEASLSGRLVALRERVIAAENAVESYKAENGLVGARDQLVAEQQLHELTTQMMAARARAEEARAQIDLIEANKVPNRANIAALASQLNSASLAALRTQQATNHAQLANLEAQLGPRHPQVIEARARASASDRAVADELARIAQSQRVEYQRAKQVEQKTSAQLDVLKAQSSSNGESAVGLRDLQRQADAARAVYDLFVTRSRESGEIQQVEPSRTHVISEATAPKSRAFPPGALVMASGGALAGALIGLLLVLSQEGLLGVPGLTRRSNEVAVEAPDASAPERDFEEQEEVHPETANEAPRRFAISERTALESTRWLQDIEDLDLTGLGIPAATRRAELAEFDELLVAATAAPHPGRPAIIAVVGSNRASARTSLSLNLALAAKAQGRLVALFDAAADAAPLTRAVRQVSRTWRHTGRQYYQTRQDILLAIPEISAPDFTPERPAATLAQLSASRIELVICDGLHLDRFGKDAILENIDVVLVPDDAAAPDETRETLAALREAGFLSRASVVRFEPTLRDEQRRARARA